MKPYIPYSLLLAAASCGMAYGAATAYTTPVGYITHSIAGAGSGPPAESYISASLVQPSVYAGVSDTVSDKTVTFTGTSVPTNMDPLTNGGIYYVLEITAGPSEGWWSTIKLSTSSSVTVSDVIPVASPVSVSVRKHNTLKNYLGTNAPGLTTYNGSNIDFDEVQILDAPTGAAVSYAYISGADLGDPLNPDGVWWALGAGAIANDTVIEPGYAVLIKRLGAAGLTFTSSGTVKTTKTQVDIYPDWNWIGTQIANGSTLDGMQFNTQLVPTDGAGPNYDEMQFILADQSAVPFAAADLGPPYGMTMFNLRDSLPAGTDPFKEGAGVLIKRTGSPASTITIPGTVVAP